MDVNHFLTGSALLCVDGRLCNNLVMVMTRRNIVSADHKDADEDEMEDWS